MYMILVKDRTAKKQMSVVLKAFIKSLAVAGELLVTGRIIKDNDSRTGKGEPET
jgi:hypothetical protein